LAVDDMRLAINPYCTREFIRLRATCEMLGYSHNAFAQCTNIFR